MLPNRRAYIQEGHITGEGGGALTWDFTVTIPAQFGLRWRCHNGLARMESRDFQSAAVCWKRGKTSIF